MSAICGIFHKDGRPVNPGELTAMVNALNIWSSETCSIWHQGSAGFGHVMLHNTPESHHATLPLQCHTGDLVLNASARLDNRRELLRSLVFPISDSGPVPDSQLILKAYQKWGEECVDHLSGDWVFSVWNRKEKKLFLANQHVGYETIAYHETRDSFYYASALNGLFAAEDVPQEIDMEITMEFIQGRPYAPRDTYYKEIEWLKNGEFLLLKKNERRLSRYWKLNGIEYNCSNREEYYNRFLHIYKGAVTDRLRSNGRVGIFLSGRLDSTSVAALAAPVLARRGQKLHGYTSVPAYRSQPEDETGKIRNEGPLVASFTRHYSNLKSHYIHAKHVDPIAALKKAVDIIGYPVQGNNFFWIFEIFRRASKSDVKLMLSGQMGNSTVSAKSSRQGLTSIAKNYLKKILFYGLFYAHRSGIDIQSGFFDDCRLLHPAHPLYEQTVENVHNFHQRVYTMRSDLSTKKYRRWLYSSLRAPAYEFNQAASAYGLSYADPTADKQLVEFCQSLPDDILSNNGENRLLVKRGMKDVLPLNDIDIEKNTVQAGDLSFRISYHSDSLYALLDQIEQSVAACTVMNITCLKNLCYRCVEDPDQINRKEIHMLTRGLSAGYFISQIS